jgi:hypothetical protein
MQSGSTRLVICLRCCAVIHPLAAHSKAGAVLRRMQGCSSAGVAGNLRIGQAETAMRQKAEDPALLP